MHHFGKTFEGRDECGCEAIVYYALIMQRPTVRFAAVLAFLFTIVACERDAGIDDRTLIHRGNGGSPGSLDPALADDIHAFNILTDLYEGLVSVSPDGTIVPGVAESWSVSGDGLAYRFRFRDGVRWSNGTSVVPDDFVRAFGRVSDPDSTSYYAFLFDPVSDVVAVDRSTLEITLSEPMPHLLSVLSMPVASPLPPGPDEPGRFTDPQQFVGNGPFVLQDHSAAGPTRLRRNSEYRDAVAVSEVVYLPIVDPFAELNMYRAGELDITSTIPPGHLGSLRSEIPDQVRVAPSLALYYLAFDLSEPPFDNPLLRQALTMAIDRRQLVALIGRGEQPAYGIVPGGVAGYDAARYDWQSIPDPEREARARALYAQAGYSPDAPLTITYTYDAGDIHEKVALAIAAMWRDVLGVEVTLDKKEWQHFLDTRARRADWDVMRFAWFGDYDHASTFTYIFRSGDAQNLPGYRNPAYDRLVAQDPDDSAGEALLLGDYPVAPLYFYVSKHLVTPEIRGFEDNPLDRHPSRFLSKGDPTVRQD